LQGNHQKRLAVHTVTASTNNKYCKSHNKKYDQCPICYDDMHLSSKLSCGHVFCVNCLIRSGVKCALCRCKTNVTIPEKAKQLRLTMDLHFRAIDDEKDIHAVFWPILQAYDYFFTMHIYFMHDSKFMSEVHSYLLQLVGKTGNSVMYEKYLKYFTSLLQREKHINSVPKSKSVSLK